MLVAPDTSAPDPTFLEVRVTTWSLDVSLGSIGPLAEVSARAGDAAGSSRSGVDVGTVDWDDLMRRHGRRIVVALVSGGVRPALAKEIAQEAWLKIIEAHRRGKLPHLQFPGVVLTQARYLAADRRRKLEHRIPCDPWTVDREAGRDLEHRVMARDELRTIERVLRDLHPNAQRVFEQMYGGEGRSAAEIASALGLSVQRVRQIASELRGRLRQELGRTPQP